MAIQSANQTVLESDFQNFLNTEYPGRILMRCSSSTPLPKS